MHQFCIFNAIILATVKCIKGNNLSIIFNSGRVTLLENYQTSYLPCVCHVFLNGSVNGFPVLLKVKVLSGLYRFHNFILCIPKVYLEKKMAKYLLKKSYRITYMNEMYRSLTLTRILHGKIQLHVWFMKYCGKSGENLDVN